MRRAVAVEQGTEMRKVSSAVPPCRVFLGTQRYKNSSGRGRNTRKRACMKLVGQLISKRMVLQSRHSALSCVLGTLTRPTRM